jgi:hypothetical protein
MNTFQTKVDHIPCLCRVTHYTPFIHASFDEPCSPSEFEFVILDLNGAKSNTLTQLAMEDDDTFNRLQDEWEATVLEHKHMINERMEE